MGYVYNIVNRIIQMPKIMAYDNLDDIKHSMKYSCAIKNQQC